MSRIDLKTGDPDLDLQGQNGLQSCKMLFCILKFLHCLDFHIYIELFIDQVAGESGDIDFNLKFVMKVQMFVRLLVNLITFERV